MPERKERFCEVCGSTLGYYTDWEYQSAHNFHGNKVCTVCVCSTHGSSDDPECARCKEPNCYYARGKK